jgi:hypothetical protein
MGAVHFSIDTGLIAALKKVLPLEIFVETGTFEGDTIELVRPLFPVIHSVELSEDYYRKVEKRFNDAPSVQLHLGHSAEVLRKIRPEFAGASVLFWLDAHWCVADKTAGGMSQCPLIEELDAIGTVGPQSIVLIDDARLFLCPPPFPHEITQWPRFQKVVESLTGLSNKHEIIVANDTIMYFPSSIRADVEQYVYEHATNWLTVLDKSRDYDVLLRQLKEKEKELESAVEKERMIMALHQVAEERANEIQTLTGAAEERMREILSIKAVAEERSRLIHLINDELDGIKSHWIYRLAVRLKRVLRFLRVVK